MKLPKVSNGQAQILIGVVGLGIGLYAIYQTKDTIGKAAQATADALNPTKDTNLAYKATTGLLGEDFVIDNIGGGVASLVNWFKKDVTVTPPPTKNTLSATPKAITTVKQPAKINATLFPAIANDVKKAQIKTSGGIVHG